MADKEWTKEKLSALRKQIDENIVHKSPYRRKLGHAMRQLYFSIFKSDQRAAGG